MRDCPSFALLAPVQQLQDSQINIAELQDQLKDLQQQLASANTGSMLQAQETQGLTNALQKQHEQELLDQRMQASQWKARCQALETEVAQWKTQFQDLQEQVCPKGAEHAACCLVC